MMNGKKRHGRHHGVRQEVAEHDDSVGHAERARRLDIFEIAPAQELGAHQADQAHPGKQQQDAKQHEEAGNQHRGDDQEQIKLRHRRPYFDEALKQEISPAAEIALHRAGSDADHRRHDGQHQAEQHRQPEAVDQPRQHVAALIVGAEPVVFQRAAAAVAVLGGEVAILLVQHPGRLRRKSRRRIVVDGLVGELDRRPDLDGVVLVEENLQVRIAVVGRGAEVVAEFGVRIVEDHREVILAVVVDEQRLVVGDELGEQRDHEQHEEYPQRPIAAPVGLEIVPAPDVDRRQFKTDPRGEAKRAGRLDVRRQCRPRGGRVARSADVFVDGGLDVHLRPPASRNRCADRSRYRSDRKSDSRPGRRERKCRDWRTPPDSRG